MGAVVVAASLLAGGFLTAGVDDLVIVDSGRTDYEIVVTPKEFPTTHLAAEELRRYIGRATGVKLPIVGAASAGRYQIHIASTNRLKPNGFAIQTHGRDVYLRGHDSAGRARSVDYIEPTHRGTCNAVYEFLERFVGVRWFWSDPLGEVVPNTGRIVVPASFVLKQEPRFEYRALIHGPTGSRGGDWARRNRLGSEHQMRHGHALHRLVPIDEWARRGHPEFAAMRAGTRRLKPARGNTGGHVCTGNPDVVRMIAKAATTYFASNPERRSFSISLPDGSGVCTCDLCTRYDVPGLKVPDGVHKGWPVITDRILQFYNSVAALVSAEYPDRLLGAYIYMDYLYPPIQTPALHPMVMLLVAPNKAMDIWNDEVWAFYQDLFRSWGAFHERVYSYDTCYLSRRMYGLPAPMGDRAADMIRLFDEAGLRGVYLYIGPTWESMGPDLYLLSRLLWDPKMDVERARREYYGLLYQRAARPVRAYFETAARCWREGRSFDRDAVARLANTLTQTKEWARTPLAELAVGYGPNLATLERYVIEAERLAAGDELLRRRVARLRDNYTLTAATVAGLRTVFDYELAPRKDRRMLRPLIDVIETRETLIDRVGRSYAPVLRDTLRFADDYVGSPLLFGGHHHKLARR